LVFEFFEDKDAGAGEEGADDLEAGVFGGGADEDNVAALDMGEEAILLSFVPAVNFIEEDDRRVLEGELGAIGPIGLDDFFDVFGGSADGGKFVKLALEGIGDDAGEGGFAGAGRAPKDEGREPSFARGFGRAGVVFEELADYLVLTDEVLLADEFGELGGAETLGERLGHKNIICEKKPK